MQHTNQQTGNLVEVFSGIQGEGLYVGRRQIFIRLCGCNLACDFCDTPDAQSGASVCRIERSPGTRDFAQIPNPVSIEQVMQYVKALDKPSGLHHCAVLTGGEPLLDIEWAVAIAHGLKESGMHVMIETNGTLADSLAAIIPFTDIISMDIKLLSASGSNTLDEHKRFISVATQRRIYVKMVVCSTTQAEEVRAAAEIVSRADRSIPVVLQPATERGGVRPPSPDQVLAWQAVCAEYVDDVRVIPQCHKILGQL